LNSTCGAFGFESGIDFPQYYMMTELKSTQWLVGTGQLKTSEKLKT
jgi:hypothetical protein